MSSSSATPTPTQATIQRIRDVVVELGGSAERRLHSKRYTRFEVDGEEKLVEKCSCGETALIGLPYRDEQDRLKKFILCCVCDAAYLLPRFEADAA